MKDKLENVILAIISVLAVFLVIFALIMVSQKDSRNETPCEELQKQRNGSTYVPMPKRCE